MEEQEVLEDKQESFDEIESDDFSEQKVETKQPEVLWEFRIAKTLVLFLYIALVGSVVFVIFASAYRGATTSPKVWKVAQASQKSNVQMKPTRIRTCVRNLQVLDREQYQHTESLWFQMRHGHRGHLTLWQEWSRDWRRRLKTLQKQCPMALRKGASNAGSSQKLLPLGDCAKKFGALSSSLKKKSSTLWSSIRKGQRKHIRRWGIWSSHWQRRMKSLVERCPLNDKGEIAKSFHRASKKMLELQAKQERVLLPFFSRSSDLFRDIRQSMHSLKEELR